MNNFDDTMKIIKWARKRGACLIKVNGVELTFPLEANVLRDAEYVRANPAQDTTLDDTKAEVALRSALSSDALNQIEDQEKWFHNNRPPQIV